MRQNGYLSDAEYQSARTTPLTPSPRDGEAAEAPYFVDLTNDELQSNVAEGERNHPRVYTTVDLNLQRMALEAVRIGMERSTSSFKNLAARRRRCRQRILK